MSRPSNAPGARPHPWSGRPLLASHVRIGSREERERAKTEAFVAAIEAAEAGPKHDDSAAYVRVAFDKVIFTATRRTEKLEDE